MFTHLILKVLVLDKHLLLLCKLPYSGGYFECVAGIHGKDSIEESDDKAESQVSCEPVEPFQYPRMDKKVVDSTENIPVECVLGTDYSLYIESVSAVVPQLDIHPFYKDKTGNIFHECDAQCHDYEQNSLLKPSLLHTGHMYKGEGEQST